MLRKTRPLALMTSPLTTRLATARTDILAAQRLRYDVFVTEMGAIGDGVDHGQRTEADQFDAHAEHLLLEDPSRPEGQELVGVYRLMTSDAARAAGGFYSQSEFDLSPLMSSGLRLLELGRACVLPDYRGGQGMAVMWAALVDYVRRHQIDILFGTASFHDTSAASLAQPLACLHYDYPTPSPLRVHAIGGGAIPMNTLPGDQLDRKAAMLAIPALIKSYLRLGGTVGSGAYVDSQFGTTDVCLIVQTAEIPDKALRMLERTR